MANIMPERFSFPALLAVVAVLFLLKRIHWELTVGAARRRMIKEYGCKPVKQYPHKGLLGKYFGYDTLTQNVQAAKAGRFFEMVRIRNYTGQNTLQQRGPTRSFIHTIEPENVKTMLSTNFNDWGIGPLRAKTLEPVFGNGIFTKDGESWSHSRAMLRPSFTRQQVGDLNVYERHVQHLLALIPKDGSTVDLQELFFRMTMDTATEFLFGKSTNTLQKDHTNPDAERFTDAFTYVTERMANEFRTARLSRFVPDQRRKEDSEFIRNFAANIIKDAIARQQDIEKGLESDQRQYTFLYELLKVTKDPYVLQSELMNTLLAGRDTTASLLGETFFQLARRPDIWAKLQKDVEQLNGKLPDYETLKSLKYVKWVLNESLRLFPVVPQNNRIALRDTVLPTGGGPDEKSPIFVPKGMPCQYSLWTMHRREDFYGKDALEYRPERWEKLRTGWEYLPFNGGPRICIGKFPRIILPLSRMNLQNPYCSDDLRSLFDVANSMLLTGQNFALTEATYVLVRILQTFKRIESRDDRPWFEFITLTLACGNGALCGLYTE